MLAPGTVLFDKYCVDRVIGRGGMAIVVAATHVDLGEPVAIKMLLPEMAAHPEVVQRFLREARAAVRLKGEHVARVIDVGTQPSGPPYMVMEYLDGADLDLLLKDHTSLPPQDAVDFLLQACEALAEAHSLGIVHRDIKPANLFITRRPDGSLILKVLDFGISKTEGNEVSTLTQHAMLGTPAYTSPEQLRGRDNVDGRADIWSIGVVLYEAVSGSKPFDAESVSALAIKAVNDPTPKLAVELPPGLDAIVYRCLEKDPDRRFQTIAELAYALAPYAGDQRAAAIVVERTRGIQRWTPQPSQSLATPPGAPKDPTTLGSSVGALMSPSGSRGRLRWAIAGGLGVGMIAVLVLWTSLGANDAVTPGAAPAATDRGIEPAPTQAAPTAEPSTAPEPANAEPAKEEPANVEPAKEEPAKMEPASVEATPPVETTPTQAETTPVEPDKAAKPKPARKPQKPKPEDPDPESDPLDTRM